MSSDHAPPVPGLDGIAGILAEQGARAHPANAESAELGTLNQRLFKRLLPLLCAGRGPRLVRNRLRFGALTGRPT